MGRADLHVPGRGEPSLAITGVELSQSLISNERHEVLARLLICAGEIAVELDGIGMGNGCLEWHVSAVDAPRLLRQFPDFVPIDLKGKRAKRLRGKRALKRC